MGGGDGDVAFSFDFVKGNAEHLAANEVGDVDVLGCWGRHSEHSMGVWLM